jgi:RHS repeat-associated protein
MSNRSFNAPEYKYGFNGKEKDDETTVGGGSYDFGARIYDGRLGRWLSLDPLMAKYPQLSPYNFVDNSPIYCKDGDGRDIIVLCGNIQLTKDPDAKHIVGHQAALIGNDETGWDFYSFDRDKASADGSNDNFTSGKHFGSLEEFRNSEYNSFKDDYDDGKGTNTSHKDKDGKIVQRFDNGYRITTSKSTDADMRQAAVKPFEQAYSVPNENECTSVVKSALDAGKLNNGEITRENANMPYAYDKQNKLPQDKQTEIEKSNKGVDVDGAIKRTDGASKPKSSSSSSKIPSSATTYGSTPANKK